MAHNRTVGVRIPDDLYGWLEERQAAFYKDNSSHITLSALVRSLLVRAMREAQTHNGKRKVHR